MSKITFDQFSVEMQKALSSAISDVTHPNNLRPIAKVLTEELKTRSSLGKHADEHGGRQKSFKKLAESTKKTRRSLRKNGKLTGNTTPAKSNITQTGKLIRSISYNVAKGKIEIFASQDYGKYVAKDRPFLFLTRGQINVLENKLADQLKSSIIRNL